MLSVAPVTKLQLKITLIMNRIHLYKSLSHVMIVQTALRAVPVGIGLFTNVSDNLVTGGVLLVALLHAGAGHAWKQTRFPDAVVIIKHSAPVAAQAWKVSL